VHLVHLGASGIRLVSELKTTMGFGGLENSPGKKMYAIAISVRGPLEDALVCECADHLRQRGS
jgi:hypothetical protein